MLRKISPNVWKTNPEFSHLLLRSDQDMDLEYRWP
jgi:hypothetical protein